MSIKYGGKSYKYGALEFEWRGIAELQAAFAQLPKALAEEANAIALTHAQAAEAEVRAAWAPHSKSGEMLGELRIETIAVGPYTRAAVLVATSPQALWLEMGTVARHTRQGWERGAMPGTNVFIPAMRKMRAAFYAEVEALLERYGMSVWSRWAS